MEVNAAARDIAERCLATRSRRLSRTVTRIYDDALRPLGIGAAQLGLLVAIHRMAPAPPAAVAERLDLEKSTLSRNLGRLRRLGLVRERPDGSGKRLTLTAGGVRLLEAAYPRWQEAQRVAVAALGPTLTTALTNPTT